MVTLHFISALDSAIGKGRWVSPGRKEGKEEKKKKVGEEGKKQEIIGNQKFSPQCVCLFVFVFTCTYVLRVHMEAGGQPTLS